MTAPAVNGNQPTVTDRGDARRRMRVVRDAGEAASGGGSASGSAYTRAIPADPDVRPAAKPSKVRNFASHHGGDAKAAFVASWPLNERPSPLAEVARRVIPARGEFGSKTVWLAAFGVGVFQLGGLSVLWLLALLLDSRKRAAVTLLVLALAAGVHLAARAAT